MIATVPFDTSACTGSVYSEVNMLHSKRSVAITSVKTNYSQMAIARPVTPVAARRVFVRPTVARALLWPRESQNSDPLDAIIQVVLTWIDESTAPPQQGDDSVPEYPEDQEAHSGWVHSHIADRLATESSLPQEM